jgi:protein-tyrosine phosphatase
MPFHLPSVLVLIASVAAGCQSDAATPSDPPATERDPVPPVERALDDSSPNAGGTQPRWILTGHLDNARDLGGTPLGEGAAVAYGALFRGPPLAGLSAEGCDEVAALGIQTVIDFRTADERHVKPETACVFELAQLVEAPLPVPYNVSPADYIADLNATDSIAAVFRLLADAEAYPIYMHCTWGRDRTGVVAAVILRALGASREDILHEYLHSQPSVGAYPLSLEATLDEIEARGGIASYLDAAGVSAEQLDTVRALALATE